MEPECSLPCSLEPACNKLKKAEKCLLQYFIKPHRYTFMCVKTYLYIYLSKKFWEELIRLFSLHESFTWSTWT
jgi:hypothetical protein